MIKQTSITAMLGSLCLQSIGKGTRDASESPTCATSYTDYIRKGEKSGFRSQATGLGILAGLIVLCFGLLAGSRAAFATSTVIYSNFTPSNGSGYDGANYYTVKNSGFNGTYFTDTNFAVTFTVPSGTSYKLDKIEVVGAQTTGYGSRLHAHIETATSMRTIDYNAVSQLSASPSLVVFDATTYPTKILHGSQTYYLIVEVDTGPPNLSVANWYKNSAGVNGTVLYNDPSTGSTNYQVVGTNIQYPVFRISATAQPKCSGKVTYYDNSLITPWYDGANCYIKPVPSGATPFILGLNYYITPDKSATCLPGTGWYDNANCVYMLPKPATGFIVNDKMYVPPVGGVCSLGTLDSTGNCLVAAAPWGTHAFEYANNWYFTMLFTCRDGGYDGANCYIMKAPPGVTPFIYANNFYYHE